MKQIIESDIFNQLLLATEDYDYNTKKEAIIAIMNICLSTNFYLSTCLVNKGVFDILKDILDNKNDNELVDMALTSIDCILQTGEAFQKLNGVNFMCKKFSQSGGVSILENFQSHHNNFIYKKAMNILEKYFDIKVRNCEDLVPSCYNNFRKDLFNIESVKEKIEYNPTNCFLNFNNAHNFNNSQSNAFLANNSTKNSLKFNNSVTYNYSGPNGKDETMQNNFNHLVSNYNNNFGFFTNNISNENNLYKN
jgi:hypothetical protein